MTKSDDYLWDRSGEVDPDVAWLEQVLQPLAHDERELRDPETNAPRGGGGRPRLLRFVMAAAAVLLVAGTLSWLLLRTPAPKLFVAGTEQRLYADARFVATKERNQLELEGFGDFTFRPGSSVRVERVASDQTSLYLEHGMMHAFVNANAKPEFFQVGTPAARCVDLGCRYELDVDEKTGDAEVRVMTGRVAFRSGRGAEVWIPAEAKCRATKEHGPETPYFEEDEGIYSAAIADFDAARDAPRAERRKLAAEVFGLAETVRQLLPVWHMLRDRDADIARAAERTLFRVDPSLPKGGSHVEWRTHLFGYGW